MTRAIQTPSHRAQRIDGIATHILALVEQAAPVASPDAQLGDEALLAALARRLGPVNYVSLLGAICASNSR